VQYKSYTILTRGLSSAALAKEEGRKLHPSPSASQITPRQGRKPAVLSEELLLAQKREEKTCLSRRSP